PSAVRGIGLDGAGELAGLAAVTDWAATGLAFIKARDVLAITTAAVSMEATYAFFMSNTLLLRYLFASGSLPLGPMIKDRPSARMISRAAPSFLVISRA